MRCPFETTVEAEYQAHTRTLRNAEHRGKYTKTLKRDLRALASGRAAAVQCPFEHEDQTVLDLHASEAAAAALAAPAPRATRGRTSVKEEKAPVEAAAADGGEARPAADGGDAGVAAQPAAAGDAGADSAAGAPGAPGAGGAGKARGGAARGKGKGKSAKTRPAKGDVKREEEVKSEAGEVDGGPAADAGDDAMSDEPSSDVSDGEKETGKEMLCDFWTDNPALFKLHTRGLTRKFRKAIDNALASIATGESTRCPYATQKVSHFSSHVSRAVRELPVVDTGKGEADGAAASSATGGGGDAAAGPAAASSSSSAATSAAAGPACSFTTAEPIAFVRHTGALLQSLPNASPVRERLREAMRQVSVGEEAACPFVAGSQAELDAHLHAAEEAKDGPSAGDQDISQIWTCNFTTRNRDVFLAHTRNLQDSSKPQLDLELGSIEKGRMGYCPFFTHAQEELQLHETLASAEVSAANLDGLVTPMGDVRSKRTRGRSASMETDAEAPPKSRSRSTSGGPAAGGTKRAAARRGSVAAAGGAGGNKKAKSGAGGKGKSRARAGSAGSAAGGDGSAAAATGTAAAAAAAAAAAGSAGDGTASTPRRRTADADIVEAGSAGAPKARGRGGARHAAAGDEGDDEGGRATRQAARHQQAVASMTVSADDAQSIASDVAFIRSFHQSFMAKATIRKYDSLAAARQILHTLNDGRVRLQAATNEVNHLRSEIENQQRNSAELDRALIGQRARVDELYKEFQLRAARQQQ